MSVTIFRWFLLWLLLAVVFAFISGRECIAYYRLSRNGVAVPGHVLEKKPHMLIRYSFEANGNTYEGIGRGDSISPSFNELSIGDQILVNYLPNAPHINCLGDPAELYSNEFASAIIVILVFPTILVGILVVRQRRKSSPSQGFHVGES